MKWISVGFIVSIVISVLLLVLKPSDPGPLEVDGVSSKAVAAEIEQRVAAFSSNPVALLMSFDGGLSSEVDKVTARARRVKKEGGSDARTVISKSVATNRMLSMRMEPLTRHVYFTIAGLLFACLGLLAIWGGSNKNGAMVVLFGCAAPILSGQVQALLISVPLLIIAMIHGAVGGRRG